MLPPRLAAVAAQVPRDAVLVDVGTDHAQLPVNLVANGHVKRALAVDIAKGPLSRAEFASGRFRDRIEVRQSDGLRSVRPGEVSCIAIAGMGGLTVAKILTEGVAVCAEASRIIVQPQGMEAEVRTVLLSMNWGCVYGALVRDRRHIYVVESWEPNHGATTWSPDDLRWGKLVRSGQDPLYADWLEHKLANIQQAIRRMMDAGQAGHPDAHRLRQEHEKLMTERATCRSSA